MFKYLKYLIPVTLVLGALIGFLTYNSLFGSYVNEETTITIPKGTSYPDLIEILKEQQLYKNTKVFDVLASKMNFKANVHSGKYVFQKGNSLYDLIVKLRGAHQTPVTLTINNVNFKADLAGKIGSQLEIDSLEFYDFITNDSSVAYYDYNIDNILCLFIPNTYEVYWNMSLSSFIDKMNKEHQNFWNNQRLAKAKQINLSPKEVFILASIVEKEYKFPEERTRIAGVYLNRIKKNMKLQADPTVKFALGDLSLKRILNVHLEYPSAYNTYFTLGLPPGPICMPETSTIEAVLNAESHNYIYFCAKEDLSGYHVFNSSYNGHLKAAKLYQKALNKLKIYE